MWALLVQVQILPLKINAELFINNHYLNTSFNNVGHARVCLLFPLFGTNTILIFVRSYGFICVGVPEWLSGMTRNHVGFASAGLNPAAHDHDQC